LAFFSTSESESATDLRSTGDPEADLERERLEEPDRDFFSETFLIESGLECLEPAGLERFEPAADLGDPDRAE